MPKTSFKGTYVQITCTYVQITCRKDFMRSKPERLQKKPWTIPLLARMGKAVTKSRRVLTTSVFRLVPFLTFFQGTTASCTERAEFSTLTLYKEREIVYKTNFPF